MQIMYELWLTCMINGLDREVNMEFLIPKLFDTRKAAEKAHRDFYVKPAVLDTGEIVFEIYGKRLDLYNKARELLIDTIHWNDYKKYHSIILKKDSHPIPFEEIFPDEEFELDGVGKILCTSEIDFEPCAKHFEYLYEKYLNNQTIEDICKTPLICMAYEIKAVPFYE